MIDKLKNGQHYLDRNKRRQLFMVKQAFTGRKEMCAACVCVCVRVVCMQNYINSILVDL